MTNEESGSPKVLSLFTGAGGLDLGLEMAGYSMIGYLEYDALARDALQKNRATWRRILPDDVCAAANVFRPEHVGLEPRELDMIAGAPPCQPFSMAAQWAAGGRTGMNDNRANTVTAMLDLVQSYLPKILFIENVAGFVKGKNSALPEIKRRLNLINLKEETSYHITWSVVDCAVYGVPQNRKRAVIVATRDGRPFTFPPISHFTRPVTAWDAIGDIDPGPTPSPNGRWTELLPCIPEGLNYQWLTSRGGGDELFGYRTRYWSFLLKLARDRPSWTIPASPGPSTGPFHWDNRPLTIPELLRLQSFPIDWTLAGSHRDQVRLAGNATPPLLSEVIGRAMLHQLLERPVPADSPRLRVAYSHNPVPPPAPPEPLPTRFRPLVGSKAPHAGTGLGPGAHPRLLSDSFESTSPTASLTDA